MCIPSSFLTLASQVSAASSANSSPSQRAPLKNAAKLRSGLEGARDIGGSSATEGGTENGAKRRPAPDVARQSSAEEVALAQSNAEERALANDILGASSAYLWGRGVLRLVTAPAGRTSAHAATQPCAWGCGDSSWGLPPLREAGLSKVGLSPRRAAGGRRCGRRCGRRGVPTIAQC